MIKDQVLKKLQGSLINNKEEIETKGLEQLIENTNNLNDAIELVKKIDKLTKRSKKKILTLAYQEGKISQRFKMNNRFVSAATEFGISKTTINFKIDIVNFIRELSENEKVLYLAFLP